jgi:hypothetical protein
MIINCNQIFDISPINPLAVLNRLMGFFPSVTKNPLSPNPFNNFFDTKNGYLSFHFGSSSRNTDNGFFTNGIYHFFEFFDLKYFF